MKTLLTAIVILCSFACMANSVMRTPHKKGPLKGKVKTVRSVALMTSDEAELRAYGRNHYVVDSYNANGLRAQWYHVDATGITGGRRYKYNNKGIKIEEEYFDNGGKHSERTTYLYDSSGKLALEVTNTNGKFSWQTRYTYNSGLLIARTDSSEYRSIRTDYKYNTKKELVIKDVLSSGVVERTEYKYDAKGRMIEETYHHPDHGPMTTKYGYYDNGNILWEAPRYRRTTFTYDLHGNETLAVESAPDGSGEGRRFVSEYVYDKEGNYIRCLSDEVEEKKMLEITYY